jgi:hypothetical protein
LEEVVSKAIAVCPFSKVPCRECAIYRGRHIEMCAAARKREGADSERPRVKSSEVFTCWEFPDIEESPGRMVNIEDFIERRGL